MLPTLQAERQLRAIEAASVPHMDRDGRADTIRKYTLMLGVDAKAKPATTADLAAMGITRETVNAEGVVVGDGTRRDRTEGT